jgi:hypothetical protein
MRIWIGFDSPEDQGHHPFRGGSPMASYPKGNVLPDHVRNAIRAYLEKRSPDRPIVISSAVRDIQAQNHFEMSDKELTAGIATEAIEAGLNIHFDGPIE